MTARTVIGSNGRARRVLLNQPPHFRTGRDAPVVQDAAVRGADIALHEGRELRSSLRRNNGRKAA